MTMSEPERTLARRQRRIESAAIAGVVYAVLAAVSLILLKQAIPDPSSTEQEWSDWIGDAGNRRLLLLALNLSLSFESRWFEYSDVPPDELRKRIRKVRELTDNKNCFFQDLFSRICYRLSCLLHTLPARNTVCRI